MSFQFKSPGILLQIRVVFQKEGISVYTRITTIFWPRQNTSHLRVSGPAQTQPMQTGEEIRGFQGTGYAAEGFGFFRDFNVDAEVANSPFRWKCAKGNVAYARKVSNN